MKHVVVLGAGFGGLACAQALSCNANITLIDQREYHTIHSNLYEVATAPEEITSAQLLKHSVAVPLRAIFSSGRVTVKKAKVVSVDEQQQKVVLDHGSVSYDYLVCALGAQPNYYAIPGAEAFAIPLQTVADALKIRNAIEFAVQRHRHDTQKDVVRLVIAGGGVAGVEIAAELQGMMDFVSWKNNYPRKKIETVVIEGAPQLVSGFGGRMSQDVQERLEQFGVRVLTHQMITNVEQSFIALASGERMEYDALVWAAGVKAVTVPFQHPPQVARGDRVEVDEYFRVQGLTNVFVVGDQGCHHMNDGTPLPGTASQAIDQGKYVAEAIAQFAQNKQPAMHTCKQYPILIPLHGRWAVFKSKRWYMKGYAVYWLRELVWLHYLAGLIGWWKALRLVWFNENLYSKNNN